MSILQGRFGTRVGWTAALLAVAVLRPAAVRGQDFEAPDEPGQDSVLNHQLWEFAGRGPYPERYLARRHEASRPDSALPLPDGWRLAPAGTQVPVGKLPFAAVWYRGRLVVLDAGFYGSRGQEISVVDPESARTVSSLRVPALFPSAARGPGGELYVSGGFARKVLRVDSAFHLDRQYAVGGYASGVAALDSAHLLVAYLTTGGRGAPEGGEEVVVGGGRTGDRGGGRGRLALLDTRSGRVERTAEAGWYPYDVLVAGGEVYVTALGEDRVRVFDRELRPLATMATGHTPAAMCSDGSSVYVVEQGADRLAVIPAGDTVVSRTLDLGQWGFRTGAAPTSCRAAAGRVYVTLGAVDAVAILRSGDGQLLGLVPAGWYPTSVVVHGGRMAVVSAKGVRPRRPNPEGPSPLSSGGGHRYVLNLLRGSVSLLDVPEGGAELDSMTARVRRGAPLRRPAGERDLPIRHVFYVVRENRTYDQVLGDLPRGDGDSALTLFGADVTPNAHRLAREFVTLDDFYANGEVSVLGHSFTTSGYASPFVEWLGNAAYSGRYRGYPFGTVPSTFSPDYLWDALDSAGVSYRIYGEPYYLFTAAYRLLLDRLGPDDEVTRAFYAHTVQLARESDRGGDFIRFVRRRADSAGTLEEDRRLLEDDAFRCRLSRVLTGGDGLCRALAEDPGLREAFARFLSHWAFSYRGWDLSHSDLDRAAAWKRDFERQVRRGSVPALEYIWLPNDHTAGLDPRYPNPYQLVAQNDAALGAIVHTIAHSPVWKHSLILVEEDDAQNGPDHVDATRTVALAAGPYVKRGAVVHERYDQLSLLRTVELLLGLPPLGLRDGLAAPMYGIFRTTPDTAPYRAPAPSEYLTPGDRSRWERITRGERGASPPAGEGRP